MPIAKSIEEARAWCETARMILNTGVFAGSDRRGLKSLNSEISTYLAQLKGNVPPQTFDFYSEMYRTTAGQLKEILDSTSYPSLSAQQDAIVEKRESLATLRDDLKRLVEAKRRYDGLAEPARRSLAILKATPYAQTDGLIEQFRVARELAERQPPDFEGAAEALSSFSSDARRVQREAQAAQQQQLEQLGKLPEYERLLEEKENLVESLRSLAGLRSEVELRVNLITEAKQLASQLDYKAAVAKLKLVPGRGDLAMQAATAIERARELPGVTAAHDDCRRAMGRLRLVAVRTEIDEGSAKIVSALDGIIEGPPNRDVYIEEITLLAQTLTARAEQLETRKQEIESNLNLAEQHLLLLAEHAGAEVRAPFELRLQRLQAAVTARRFDESVGPAAQLKNDLGDASLAASVAAKSWERRSGEVSGLLEQCERLLGCPPARSEGLRLKGALNGLPTLATGRDKDPEAAILRLDQLTETIQAVQQNVVDKYNKLNELRGPYDEEITLKIENLKSAINELRSSVAEARRTAGDESPQGPDAPLSFDEELTSISARWETLKEIALTAPDLKHEQILQELTTLQEAVSNAGTEEGLAKTVSAQKQGEQREVFEGKWKELETLLHQLAAYEVDDSSKNAMTAKEILVEAPEDYLAATNNLTELQQRVEQEIESAQQTQRQAQLRVQGRFDEVLLRINALELAVNTQLSESQSWFDKWKQEDPPFKELFETFRKEHSDLGAMIVSTNRKSLSLAHRVLDDLAFRVEELALRMQQMGPDMANFQGVKDAADELETRLTDTTDFQPYIPKRWELLNASFKEMKKSLGGQLPLDSMAKLREFRADLSKAENEATLAKTKREKFDTDLENTKSKAKQLDKTLEYTKSLAGQFKTLKALSETEAQEDDADQQLKDLDAEITRAINEPDFLLEKDTEVRAGALQLEQQKVQWESSLKVFEKVEIAKARRAVAGAGDPTLVDQVVRMVKSAKDLAKAKKYDEALRQLEIAKQRVAEIVKNPFGPTIGSRNELPKDLRVFKAAVAQLNAALLDFPNAVEALADGSESLEENVMQKIRALLQTLSVDVDAAAFDKSVAKLTNEATKQNDRRAEREAALATVRRYQTMLNKDPALVRIIENPIEKKKLPAGMSALYYALNRLQGNLSRCTK